MKMFLFLGVAVAALSAKIDSLPVQRPSSDPSEVGAYDLRLYGEGDYKVGTMVEGVADFSVLKLPKTFYFEHVQYALTEMSTLGGINPQGVSNLYLVLGLVDEKGKAVRYASPIKVVDSKTGAVVQRICTNDIHQCTAESSGGCGWMMDENGCLEGCDSEAKVSDGGHCNHTLSTDRMDADGSLHDYLGGLLVKGSAGR